MWPKRSVARKGEAVGRRRTKPLGSGTEDPAQQDPVGAALPAGRRVPSIN